ncbi:hypothetical protein [Microbacterium trichothecenolyticum]|uniref:DUF3558 domain-containing protein n=1 Tax=Microbacterium trichothecenolyticum TaxID=69370 RepID=A0ABU0TUM5_MICTR|nr:hypothetical protein [Microbacterium trichothecenolyticum]MDQ1123366.1 hypothetical protein [Microbacterium trichothecenolyticum]
MPRRPLHPIFAAVLVGAAVVGLSACAPETGGQAAPTGTETAASSTSPTPIPTITPSTKPVTLPTDCRAILSADVLAQLGSIPLNDPAMGPSGLFGDGSLVCIWRDPATDTTGLVTRISQMDRGPALDMLNDLVSTQGFSCYTPDEGTRCEKTWINPTYPVNDGRTLFWRDGVLIDTQYSNLAPTGYTASIIASIFGTSTPAPTPSA